MLVSADILIAKHQGKPAVVRSEPTFYIWPFLHIELRRWIYNVFSHGLQICLVIDNTQDGPSSVNLTGDAENTLTCLRLHAFRHPIQRRILLHRLLAIFHGANDVIAGAIFVGIASMNVYCRHNVPTKLTHSPVCRITVTVYFISKYTHMFFLLWLVLVQLTF